MRRFLSKSGLFSFTVAVTIAITGMLLISSCGTTSVTYDEAAQAGDTIGRLIRGE